MAATSSLFSEDQCPCSICLGNAQCQRPRCEELSDKQPELQVKTLRSQPAAQFRQSVQKKISSSSEQEEEKEEVVLCDVCDETKLKALKSCLVCLTSYCETHLELHQKITVMTRHKLIDPVKNLEDRMCKKHDRPLELFCKTDQMCVCQSCAESDHKLHHIVPMIEEYEGKKAELGKTETDVQQMIEERRLKIQQIKQSVKFSKEDADRETAANVQVFTDLIQSVERMEQLLRTEDHLKFLQSFSSLNPAPPTKDWTDIRVQSSYEETVRRAVAQLKDTLSKELEKLRVHFELRRVQQYAVDVTLDPDTAHPYLILSDDGKQVSHGDVKQILPDNPERFSSALGVLGKQRMSSGRFYFEVQVKEKTDWILGVSRESINRKGYFMLSPENGHWTVGLMKGNEYKALAGPSVCLPLRSKPEKVGVFVEYEEGLVSFYDVNAVALMYSFTDCTFTEKLCPYFNPSHNADGENSPPLIICPVSNTS
ncbi:zinc finger protein RFP-like [Thunnus albacares]|uniref:zinc finger protein RFP-like n=1 Tax=Thunnus albacares TaxID=8236 RepID=UPI001CF68ECA|nr:zinc finger protein RFP-like [Thunnus albacares]